MFQAGNFSVPGRLINFVGKGAIFGCLGFGAGIMGTSLSNGLLEIRWGGGVLCAWVGDWGRWVRL